MVFYSIIKKMNFIKQKCLMFLFICTKINVQGKITLANWKDAMVNENNFRRTLTLKIIT